MSLKNPLVVSSPVLKGLDAEINKLQGLFTQLIWLEKSFGRAREVNKMPLIYEGGNEYYPAVSNDALKSYCFFRLNMDKKAEDYQPNDSHIFFSSPVDIIFWVDLKVIDKTKDYIYTEELIHDVLKIIAKTDTEVIRIWDERPEDIFKNYDISKTRDMLMYPYASFRIETIMRYEYGCN